MATIEYYPIYDLPPAGNGVFTVICDTELYNTVTAQNASSIVPWDRVNMSMLYAVEVGYSQALLDVVFRRGIVLMYGSFTSDQEFHYFNIDSEGVRKVRVRYRVNPNSAIVFNDVAYSTSNQCFPVALFSNGNFFNVYIMVCNDEKTLSKIVYYSVYSDGSEDFGVDTVYDGFDTAAFFHDLEPIFIPSPDPYEEAGGGEDPLPGSEIIGLPTEPTLSPIDAGLFSLYSPTAAQMRNLADFLWTDFGGTGTTVEQVLEEVVEALKRSVSNPLNSMLGLSIIASQGLSKGSDSSVHVGFWNTGVSMTKLTKQYFTVDCGSLSFNPVCGNTFLDYAPYSKFMIYLPYVGMRLLDANDVVGHTISVRYRGDCVSGALTCYVIRDGSVIQEHTGNCALNIPLTADSWAESISAVGRIISGSVSGATRGGAAGAAAGAVRGAASVATNPSAFSSQIAHTGAVSGAAGHLGSQKPFILREAVRFHSTGGFNSIIGYPSYYYRKLGDCHGFTQCLEVHLSHTPCTGVELQEIEEMLKKGVII